MFLSRLNAMRQLKNSAPANTHPLKIILRTKDCPIPQTKLFFNATTFRHYFRGWVFQHPETKVIYSTEELPRYIQEDVVYEAENYLDKEGDEVR
jgi:hypothetical protein